MIWRRHPSIFVIIGRIDPSSRTLEGTLLGVKQEALQIRRNDTSLHLYYKNYRNYMNLATINLIFCHDYRLKKQTKKIATTNKKDT